MSELMASEGKNFFFVYFLTMIDSFPSRKNASENVDALPGSRDEAGQDPHTMGRTSQWSTPAREKEEKSHFSSGP